MLSSDLANDQYFMDVEPFGVLEEVECDLCNENQTSLVAEQAWFGETFKVVQCDNCKLIYTNPRPTPL